MSIKTLSFDNCFYDGGSKMKIKNFFRSLILGIFLILAFNISIAQEVVETEDMQIFSYTKGAELRFLQLEKSLEKNILAGNLALEKVDDEILVEILDRLSILLDKTKNIDLSQDSKDIASEYVLIKQEAIELTNSFREIVHKEIKPEEVEERRTAIKDQQRKVEDNFGQRISEIAKSYSNERRFAALQRHGLVHEEARERIRDNLDNAQVIRDLVSDELKSKSFDERLERSKEIRETKSRINIQRQNDISIVRNIVREKESVNESVNELHSRISARIGREIGQGRLLDKDSKTQKGIADREDLANNTLQQLRGGRQ
jgi:hypothetical protein